MARALLLCLLLTGCGLVAPGYRDTAAPIASMAAFDPERYLGRWYQVALYPNAFQARCAGAIAEYSAGPGGEIGVRNICLDQNGTQIDQITGTARVVGPGRLSVRLAGVPWAGPYWVLWVDEDYRTAVVGAPNGRVGWVLNRTPDIAPDRLIAARTILAANGYDPDRLVRSVTP